MFWFRKKSVPYIALSERDSNSSEEGERFLADSDGQEKGDDFAIHVAEKKKSKLTPILIILTIVLSIVNLTFFVRHYLERTSSKASTSSDADLELASAYIGLDKLYGSETAFNYTIETMPLVVGTVDREHPDSVRPDETPHWWTYQGTVVPDRRHIFINEAISTIVQFRALDFGLETCQPTLVLPTYSSLIDANSTVKSENDKPRTYSFSSPNVPVHIWELESTDSAGRDRELDLARLTFANRPQRKTYLGTVDAREGVRTTAEAFACKSASLHTLELSCETPGCMLDFWTDEIEPRMAFFVKQSSS